MSDMLTTRRKRVDNSYDFKDLVKLIISNRNTLIGCVAHQRKAKHLRSEKKK